MSLTPTSKLGAGVGVGSSVGVALGVGLGVSEGVGADVGIAVGRGEGVGVALGLIVATGEGVPLGLGEALGLVPGSIDGIAVGLGDGVVVGMVVGMVVGTVVGVTDGMPISPPIPSLPPSPPQAWSCNAVTTINSAVILGEMDWIMAREGYGFFVYAISPEILRIIVAYFHGEASPVTISLVSAQTEGMERRSMIGSLGASEGGWRLLNTSCSERYYPVLRHLSVSLQTKSASSLH